MKQNIVRYLCRQKSKIVYIVLYENGVYLVMKYTVHAYLYTNKFVGLI